MTALSALGRGERQEARPHQSQGAAAPKSLRKSAYVTVIGACGLLAKVLTLGLSHQVRQDPMQHPPRYLRTRPAAPAAVYPKAQFNVAALKMRRTIKQASPRGRRRSPSEGYTVTPTAGLIPGKAR